MIQRAKQQKKKKKIRVTGHVAEVRGIYHIKLSWTDSNGKRCRKSTSTGLAVKGNTKRAEDMLRKARKEQEEIVNLYGGKPRLEDWLFADFMEEWLEVIRLDVKLTTFGGYQMNVQKAIVQK
jgi:hypothetical protein